MIELVKTLSLAQFHATLGALIFAVGVLGFLSRRSGIVALMCIELMLNGINLSLVSFANLHGNPEGPVLVLFIVLVAAAEAALALSLLVSIFRRVGTISIDDLRTLKG